jgi:hypothetical protein
MAYTEADWDKVQSENVNGPEDLDDNWYHKVEKPNMEEFDNDNEARDLVKKPERNIDGL